MKIGIRGHDLGKGNEKVFSNLIKEYGFDGVQLVCYKALEGISYEEGSINLDKALKIGNALKDNSIDVPLIGSYFNPVHSNKDKVKKGINIFKEYINYASILGSKYVGSETGSFNDDKWTYHPNNRTEEAYKEVSRIFKEIDNYAKEKGVHTTLEGAFGHVAYNPYTLKYIVDLIDSDNIRIIVDIFNYLDISNYMEQLVILEECLRYFKDKIVVFHLKDFYVENNEIKRCPLGKGLMNYPVILKRIKEECPNAYLIFEGVTGDDIKPSLKYIKKELEEL